jgi:hypothetical protein
MSKKVERLARELISLRLKYSDRDFQEATELLHNGQFFQSALVASNRAGDELARARRGESGTSPHGMERSEGAEEAISALRRRVREQESLRIFVEGFLDRKLLKNSSAIRSFSDTIGLSLPKKLPSRIALAQRLVNRLEDLAPERRERALAQASTFDRDGSSLQQWSDVIVKY